MSHFIVDKHKQKTVVLNKSSFNTANNYQDHVYVAIWRLNSNNFTYILLQEMLSLQSKTRTMCTPGGQTLMCLFLSLGTSSSPPVKLCHAWLHAGLRPQRSGVRFPPTIHHKKWESRRLAGWFLPGGTNHRDCFGHECVSPICHTILGLWVLANTGITPSKQLTIRA